MKNIVLIGMPGTGKSTAGVILAKRLGYDFLDTDIFMAKREGRSLPAIIEQDGLERFLELEGEAGQAVNCTSTVIATGGSMVFSEAAMKHLKKNAVIIWLDTPIEILEERLSSTAREDRGVAAPADMTVRDIYELRKPLYFKYADLRLRCTPGVDSVVSDIRSALICMDLSDEVSR